MWFLSMALGDNIAGQLSGQYDSSHLESLPGLFRHVFWYCMISGPVMLLLTPWTRHLMAGVELESLTRAPRTGGARPAPRIGALGAAADHTAVLRRAAPRAVARSAGERPLQRLDVELHHLHHRIRRALALGAISISHHVDKHRAHYLPRDPKAILEPAALLSLAALQQRIPVAINLCLVLTVHYEGDRMIELIVRACVIAEKFCPAKTKSTTFTDPPTAASHSACHHASDPLIGKSTRRTRRLLCFLRIPGRTHPRMCTSSSASSF